MKFHPPLLILQARELTAPAEYIALILTTPCSRYGIALEMTTTGKRNWYTYFIQFNRHLIPQRNQQSLMILLLCMQLILVSACNNMNPKIFQGWWICE